MAVVNSRVPKFDILCGMSAGRTADVNVDVALLDGAQGVIGRGRTDGMDEYGNVLIRLHDPDIFANVVYAEGPGGPINAPVFVLRPESGTASSITVRRCPTCHAELRPQAIACPQCGWTVVTAPLAEEEPDPPTPQGPRSAWSEAAPTAGVMLALGLILLGFITPRLPATTSLFVFYSRPVVGTAAIVLGLAGGTRGRGAIAIGLGGFLLITWLFGLAGIAFQAVP